MPKHGWELNNAFPVSRLHMSSLIQSVFEASLSSLAKPEKLPRPLPLAHLTKARLFDQIVRAGRIDPQVCAVFRDSLVYLSYGGVLYHTSTEPTQDTAELPVVFIFKPSVLELVQRYYPFDTGALAKGYYKEWGTKLGTNGESYKVEGKGNPDVPSQMVFHLYKDNRAYLDGKVDSEIDKKPSPFPELFEFFKADLTADGVDDRKLAIEALSAVTIPFESLIFVAYPTSKAGEFRTLFESVFPTLKPDFHAYHDHTIFRPSFMAAAIREIAHNKVFDKYLD